MKVFVYKKDMLEFLEEAVPLDPRVFRASQLIELF